MSMSLQEALIPRFEKHIQELSEFTEIPSDWAWWDKRDKKFKKLAELDSEIVQDILDLHDEKWIQPLEAANTYELMHHLESELTKVQMVIKSLSSLSQDLYRIRDRQLTEVNQREESEKLNIIIGAVDHHLRRILVGLAQTLHEKDTRMACEYELQEFTKELLQEPSLKKWLTGVYVSGKLLHRTVEEDLIVLIKGRSSILNDKERMIANLCAHLEKNISKKLVNEVLKQYGFKPELDIDIKLVYNNEPLFDKYLGEWKVLYEHELSELQRIVCWVKP